MNVVGKIAFDFQADDMSFVRSLYGSWDDFFYRSVERLIDEVLSVYDHPGGHLTVESLTLDVGHITRDNFYEDFPRRLKEKLEEAMSQLKYGGEPSEMRATKVSMSDDAYSLLTSFLLHGRIDPVQLARYGGLNDLFLAVVGRSGKRFSAFLRTYGHYTGLRERITGQFDNEALEAGVRILHPAEGVFICSYVRFLHKRYRKLERPAITATGYRYAVWNVVYSYLLGNRSSYFNRKSFLVQTLVSLAARLNITFEYLAGLLAEEMPESPAELSASPELLAILSEIHRENMREEVRRAAFEPKFFYRIIGKSWKQGLGKKTEPEIIRSLTDTLAGEDSCRTFIMMLKEEEIIRLVPLVIPEERGFVVAYARELERHREKGAFEGRAGGEFSKLKWMMIFPVLLENRGTAFNRKSFVRRVLARIAGHYNLSMREIVLFLSGDDYISLLDRGLADIFRELAAELGREAAVKNRGRSHNVVEKTIELIGLVKKKGTSVTAGQMKSLTDSLSNDLHIRAIIDRTTQTDRETLLGILIPEEKSYVSAYARVLIASVGGHSEISGKTAGGFDRLVWFFIFGLLADKAAGRFNRRAFARSMLGSLSSHYNLYYADLLIWLHSYSETVRLPKIIADVVGELYEQERQVWLGHASSVPGEKEKEKLLRNIDPKAAEFILDFFRLLEWFFRTGVARLASEPVFSGINDWETLSERLRNDKWKLLFQWMASNGGKPFAKKDFVREMSSQIGLYYRIDRTLLEAGIRAATELIPGKLSADVSAAVYQIYRSLPSKDRMSGLLKNETDMNEKELSLEQSGATVIENAGLALISPYITRLFSLAQLTEDNSFKSDESRIRAIFLLQYAACGDRRTEFGEHELFLNKILVGFPPEKPIPKTCELTKEEREMVESMLKGALQHWSKLKNTSVAGLQEAFIMRRGILDDNKSHTWLTVEEKPYDLLLDSCPWSFRMIKTPWMAEFIEVKWR